MRFEIQKGERSGVVSAIDAMEVASNLCALKDISELMLETLLRIESQMQSTEMRLNRAVSTGDELVRKSDEMLARGDELKASGESLKESMDRSRNDPPA